MKVSLKRRQHINTGNFGSVDSDIMIEVDIDDSAPTKEMYEKIEALSDLVDGAQAMDLIAGVGNSLAARADAVAYLEQLESNEKNIKKTIAKSLKILRNPGDK